MGKVVSFAPENLKEGNNLFDNVKAEITSFQFTKEAPDNYKAEGNPIFAVVGLHLYELTKVAGESDEEFKQRRNQTQSYSLGASAGDNFTISADGYSLEEAVEGANPRKDSKFGTFVSALTKEGVPSTLLNNFKAILGLRGLFKRVEDKARNFGNQVQKVSKFPPSTLVCVKLVSLPGTKAAATTAAASASANTATSGDTDLDAQQFLTTVLAAAPNGKIQRGNILISVRKATLDAGVDKETGMTIAKRAAEEAFLVSMAQMGVVTYDPSAKPQAVFAVAA